MMQTKAAVYEDLDQSIARAKVCLTTMGVEKRPATVAEQKMIDVALAAIERKKSLKALDRQVAAMEASGEISIPGTTKESQGALLPITGGESKFKSWGSFLQAVANTRTGYFDPALRVFDERASELESKAMAESTGAGGGFLVPRQYREEILSAVYAGGDIARRCRLMPMSTRQLTIPAMDQTGTTADKDHWHGGMNLYWTEEATGPTEDNPEVRELNLVAHKLMGYTRVSDEVLADARVLGEFLSKAFSGGIQWMVERAIVRGTGVGLPLGILNAGATASVNRETAAGITVGDLLDMREMLLPSSKNAVWLLHPSCL